ncbi:MAG TPA: hypothetical protein VLS47_08475 [Gallionella sp.]|nr:hypothetical protein [Gallionella sp.]
MKYNAKNQMLVFSSDEEVSRFHDQLTGALRMVMLGSGGDKATSREEDMKLTREFFDRYSILAETLSSLRAHLPRKSDG